MAQTIYCDESGFTGNDLSNVDQPHFVYAAVAITPEEADAIRDRVIAEYRVYGTELKGKNLVRYARGRRAVSDILDKVASRSQCAVVHKKYALACKLYEYLFEPVLAEKNYIFYQIGFHRFVSMLVYLELQIREQNAERLFDDFERLMRDKNIAGISFLFGPSPQEPATGSLSPMIQEFCIANQKGILEEIEFLGDILVGKWILDVTGACLNCLLWHWGAKFDSLEVYCDESKPLETLLREGGIFEAMVGRTDKQVVELEGRSRQISYNLLKPIELGASVGLSGIQIADVVSSALAHALQNRTEEYSQQWLRKYDDAGAINEHSIFPMAENEAKEAILGPSGRRNTLVLRELVDRCRAGSNLLDNIEQFIARVSGMPARL
jgi:hypothetical protein